MMMIMIMIMMLLYSPSRSMFDFFLLFSCFFQSDGSDLLLRVGGVLYRGTVDTESTLIYKPQNNNTNEIANPNSNPNANSNLNNNNNNNNNKNEGEEEEGDESAVLCGVATKRIRFRRAALRTTTQLTQQAEQAEQAEQTMETETTSEANNASKTTTITTTTTTTITITTTTEASTTTTTATTATDNNSIQNDKEKEKEAAGRKRKRWHEVSINGDEEMSALYYNWLFWIFFLKKTLKQITLFMSHVDELLKVSRDILAAIRNSAQSKTGIDIHI